VAAKAVVFKGVKYPFWRLEDFVTAQKVTGHLPRHGGCLTRKERLVLFEPHPTDRLFNKRSPAIAKDRGATSKD